MAIYVQLRPCLREQGQDALLNIEDAPLELGVVPLRPTVDDAPAESFSYEYIQFDTAESSSSV
jgi:hypothetical protein